MLLAADFHGYYQIKLPKCWPTAVVAGNRQLMSHALFGLDFFSMEEGKPKLKKRRILLLITTLDWTCIPLCLCVTSFFFCNCRAKDTYIYMLLIYCWLHIYKHVFHLYDLGDFISWSILVISCKLLLTFDIFNYFTMWSLQLVVELYLNI